MDVDGRLVIQGQLLVLSRQLVPGVLGMAKQEESQKVVRFGQV